MSRNQNSRTGRDLSGEMVEQYADALFKWALYRTGDRESAEDLVQETYLAAIKSLDNFQERSNIKTWLFSILNNKIIDYHRKKFRNIVVNASQMGVNNDQDNVLERVFDENGSWKNNALPAEWTEHEENPLDNHDFNRILQSCLEKLPPTWFSAIQLKYLQEKEGSEICQELDITPSNFWQVLHRAKLRLRMCMKEKWYNIQ